MVNILLAILAVLGIVTIVQKILQVIELVINIDLIKDKYMEHKKRIVLQAQEELKKDVKCANKVQIGFVLCENK